MQCSQKKLVLLSNHNTDMLSRKKRNMITAIFVVNLRPTNIVQLCIIWHCLCLKLYIIFVQGCYDEIVHYIQGHALMIGGIAIAAIVVMVTIFICNINPEDLVLCVPACSVICILLFFYSFLVSYLEYVCVGPSAVEDTDIRD